MSIAQDSSGVYSRKVVDKKARFRYQMTEDLEEVLKRLTKLPETEDELPGDLVVSVPIQLVCTTALIAVLALPVFYLVSAHYQEAQHYSRMENLKLDLQNFRKLIDDVTMEKTTFESSMHERFSPPLNATTGSTTGNFTHRIETPKENTILWTSSAKGRLLEEELVMGSPQRTNRTNLNGLFGHSAEALIIREISEMFQFGSYAGDNHVAFFPLELLFLRLSMASIWLDTHESSTGTNGSTVTSHINGYLYEVRRILVTALIDPIIWSGVQYANPFDMATQKLHATSNNCSNKENSGSKETVLFPFYYLNTSERLEKTWSHGWPLLSQMPNISCACNGFIETFNESSSLMNDLGQILTLFDKAFWKKLPFLGDIGFNRIYSENEDETTVHLKCALADMASMIFVYLESESQGMHQKTLMVAHCSVVIYGFAVMLSLPTFFSSTL
ncbi:hypothetical protein PoB_000302100 [Plakobranchus ocellatus]|uniref:Uncharacterized protein n=1 Tax=Plakobranchus ocellatus TaxID=259542 RepID=A0AAV3Y0A3_9GAST|nr:hypothetical protein PoB_000302100 [Plakobranchus ocellatus]